MKDRLYQTINSRAQTLSREWVYTWSDLFAVWSSWGLKENSKWAKVRYMSVFLVLGDHLQFRTIWGVVYTLVDSACSHDAFFHLGEQSWSEWQLLLSIWFLVSSISLVAGAGQVVLHRDSGGIGFGLSIFSKSTFSSQLSTVSYKPVWPASLPAWSSYTCKFVLAGIRSDLLNHHGRM